jgi:transaldolase/glucose-6-phosphate isomerase
MTRLHELNELGQSIWYDNIRRSLLDSGEMAGLIEQGVVGVTSNPSIFEKAIAGSADYDEAMRKLVGQGKSVEEIYEELAFADISRTADLLRPVYERTNGRDGYVSLEVSPTLAHDTDATVSEARRLFTTLDRSNVMIKVPATPEGIPAIETLIAEGININVTLIFSQSQYEDVTSAYIRGLERLYESGGDVSKVASVASFFISRVDSAVDRALDERGVNELQGKIAIANAKVAYDRFLEIFRGERWEKLANAGARPQRPLWASTSTKNPAYPDTLYIDSLVGADTVNTVPPATLQAVLGHGQVVNALEVGLDQARAELIHLAEIGIDLDAVTRQLLDDGVSAFAQSFETLLASVSEKREKLLIRQQLISTNLGEYQSAVDLALQEMKEEQIMSRIWAHDHKVWKPEPTEITNRLGWLHIVKTMREQLDRIEALVDGVRSDGYDNVLLLGMGGSSLAPEVFSKTFGGGSTGLKLSVLDSTDPGAVLAYREQIDPTRTMFIVSTKSGGTVETLSFFKYFYNLVLDLVGEDQAGLHFVAITDPGSKLVDIAVEFKFREIYLNDPNIGGRYSALSYFGLVPAALIGVDIHLLLDRAQVIMSNAERNIDPVESDNYGALLGVIMGDLAKNGRDKLTLFTSPQIAIFGDWVEQLIAESTGKEGKGILPVVGEPLGEPGIYGNDRIFVHLQLSDDPTHQEGLASLEAAGHPMVRITLDDIYDLGAQFFLWEIATAVAGYRLGINPFDQPNVEAAKVLARQMVARYQETGLLDIVESALLSSENLKSFLAQAGPGAYIALQAYIQPTSATDQSLLDLRRRLRDQTKLATTVGYGPRFLHSTGQLHKGDAGHGLFIQFTADVLHDVNIPDSPGSPESSISFNILKNAQALGDRQALLDAGRQVIRFHLRENENEDLVKLAEGIS